MKLIGTIGPAVQKTGIINNLQILRAIAALNVVVYHGIGSAREYGFTPDTLAFLAGWGTSGVDIFFVLSGFIMVYAQSGRSLTPTAFMKNRIIRIVPLYWILTGVILLLLVVFPSVFREAEFDPVRALTSLTFLSMAILDTFPYLGVGWTLEFEMLFYLIFAGTLVFTNEALSLFLLAAVLVALVVFLGTNPIVLEFLLGTCVGWIIRHGQLSMRLGWASLVIGTALFLSTIWIAPPGPRWAHWGIPAAMIVFGAINVPEWRWKFGELLGDASYSIYLVQVFTIPLVMKILASTAPDLLRGTPAVVIAVLVSSVAGLLTYVLIERPSISWARGTGAVRQIS